jgi:hypothetical protein
MTLDLSGDLGFQEIGLQLVVNLHADTLHPGLALGDQHLTPGESLVLHPSAPSTRTSRLTSCSLLAVAARLYLDLLPEIDPLALSQLERGQILN